MTLDDLLTIYFRVWAEDRSMKPSRAALRAAVTAIRDEILPPGQRISRSSTIVRSIVADVFNEILGSDAGSEKAAGTDTVNKPEAIERSIPAAAPTCEWTLKSHKQLWNEWDAKDCRAIRHVTIFGHYDVCPSCGLPITFKETANG